MKSVKKALIAAAYVCTLAAPLGLNAVAHAQQVVVVCAGNNEIISRDIAQICDLSVDKQVSVNGGAYVEADTSPAAANATVGDTVTWKITVSNNSTDGLTPHGFAYIKDLLPAGFNLTGSSASDGTYGVWATDTWALPLLKDCGLDCFTTTLPATLTLTSTATSTGLSKNNALLFKYDQGQCDGGCTYIDGDPSNDSNDAWVNISAKPVVLAENTTLPNTGSGTTESLIAGGLIAVTLAVALLGRGSRSYKINR